MTETYQVIPDTEAVYSVSTYGNIRNNTTGFILKPFMTDKGYLQVSIQFTSRSDRITVNVHKLVARAFIKNPEGHPVVNHLDGIKTNNAASNLEWTTHLENNLHAVRMGLIKSGEDTYLHILKESEVHEIIHKLEKGSRNTELAREYGVAHNTIDDIRCNRTWRFIERLPISANGPIKKLGADDIPAIRKLFAEGKLNKEIGIMFDVAPATIDQIRKGKTWKNY